MKFSIVVILLLLFHGVFGQTDSTTINYEELKLDLDTMRIEAQHMRQKGDSLREVLQRYIHDIDSLYQKNGGDTLEDRQNNEIDTMTFWVRSPRLDFSYPGDKIFKVRTHTGQILSQGDVIDMYIIKYFEKGNSSVYLMLKRKNEKQEFLGLWHKNGFISEVEEMENGKRIALWKRDLGTFIKLD